MNTKKGILKVALALLLFLSVPKVLHEDNTGLLFFTDEQCMTANLFFEARNQGEKGMKAVALVTHWRVQSGRYGNDVCGVVFKQRQFSWTHQQSYDTVIKVLEGDLSNFPLKDYQSYLEAEKIAYTPFDGFLGVLPKWTMHYHSEKVKPKWLTDKQRVAKIGSHVFYKDKRKEK